MEVVEAWNAQREAVLSMALEKFLFPSFEKEIKAKLLSEATDNAIKVSDDMFYFPLLFPVFI